MSFISRFAPVITLLASASLAFAENAGPEAPSAPVAPTAPGGAPAGGTASMLPSILLMVGIFAFMYFVLIRPQKKEEKKRKEMLSALKRGDKVVTIGGVHGTIETIGEQTIDVRVGTGSNTLVMTFNKGAVNANMSNESADASADKNGKK
jgi:preprotein translocase subunit YajC